MISTLVPADKRMGQFLLAFAPCLVSDALVYAYAPAQLVQAKASRVMTPCLAKAAPIDAASTSATNVILMAVVCMMHRTIEACEMRAVVALMIGGKAADVIKAELRAN